MKKAFITGITGQDGSYLAEFLLAKGYEVHGLVRRSSYMNRERLNEIYKNEQYWKKRFFLHYGDVTDASSLMRIISLVMPDEIYNLAAQSHVQVSFETPEYTASTNAIGLLNILEAVKNLNLKKARIYQASTSELFGLAKETPQKETTPFAPQSPYGAAKLYAYWIASIYRKSYGVFICNGILFNHESPRRGENFVSRKITKGVAEIKKGMREKISLGNLNALRDWGFAGDYIEAMWLMLQQQSPQDYVVATGKNHSVRQFVEKSFEAVGIKIKWVGEGLQEKGIDSSTGNILVEVSPEYFRPSEVEALLGDVSKARRELRWQPRTSFEDLVKMMVEHDLAALK